MLLLCLALVAGACVTATSESRSERRALSAVTPRQAAAEPAASTPPSAAPAVIAEPTPDTDPSPLAEPTDAAGVIPSLGYISLDETQAFVQIITAGVREAASEAGVRLIECDSGWTRPGVRACANELARANVDGVISLQPFPDLTEEVCETLAGAPLIGIVYDQGPCQVSLFEIDQAESGRLAGSALGAFAAERFDCEVKAFVGLGSSAVDEIGGARLDGYEAGYEEHCDLPQRTRRLNDAQHLVTAQNKFVKVLDDIKGRPIIVAGVSEDAILGAMGAAQRRGRVKHAWYSGQLAGPAIRRIIACDDHYIASVAQFPDRFGRTVVPALVDAIGGADVAPVLQAELELITAENVREHFPDTPACDG